MAAKWKLPEGVTWKQKLNEERAGQGKIVPAPKGMQKQYGRGTMLVPRALDVDALMRKARKGKLVTPARIRARLAADAGADYACPFATGMFIRVAAEAAGEDLRDGKKRVTPYWRTVRDDGSLHEKFPGGTRAQAVRLRKEGFKIEPARGKKPPRVKDFEQHLVNL
jgi:hypothetical protein